MVTVHVVLQAHIDPAWMWGWPSGLDAVLATCRSACDRLDAHPDLHFCRGEAWAYDQVERVAPALFERIRRHVDAGRWHIVGGWWIQPDCNGPSGFALRRQIELGREYFLERFGRFPRTAYNVDSFGHAAALPELLHAAGQDRYVMMRPQEHELRLPARVFRWRGRTGGPEVVTFRIAGNYAVRDLSTEHVRAALAELPAGIEHTLCFVGLGDHGGGPTERQIAWLGEHRDAIAGCRLEFSSPERFFDAIWPQRASLPLVTGELQGHAIGCYSVHRPVKTAVRRAEHALRQAEAVLELPELLADWPAAGADGGLRAAWRQVCFGHFHDIYGGTCVPSAYDAVLARLGGARATADEIMQHALRRRLEALPDEPRQRIAAWNVSDAPFDDWLEHEVFCEHVPFDAGWGLLDEQGCAVPYQVLRPEGLIDWAGTWNARLLFPLRAAPGELRVLRIDPQCSVQPAAMGAAPAVNLHGEGELIFPGEMRLALPRLERVADASDTWSHGLDRYDAAAAAAVWQPGRVLADGPLMKSVACAGGVGHSALRAEWRVYAGGEFVELRLRVYWVERHALLRASVELPAPAVRRWDGIMLGELERPLDGREYSVHDRILLELREGRRVGVVLPDAYAASATPGTLRLTLLRSPLMAHHDPYPADEDRGVFTDQGEHTFRFRFFCGGAELTHEVLARHALALHRPPVMADLTRGMPSSSCNRRVSESAEGRREDRMR